MEINELMKKATIFHGHICPGVALGTIVAKYALERNFEHSPDEQLVAVVENDNCSVDALQALLGTTFGKGNLIHKDYGKNNYTIYSRKLQKGIRFEMKSSVFAQKSKSRDELVKKILESPANDIFDIHSVEYDPPFYAKVEESLPCEVCRQPTMSSRLLDYEGTKVCIPCYKNFKK
jgi:formylmethanofuran dehydrogenase subunit E